MHITPKNNVWYIFFFFEIYIKFPTPSIPLGGRYDIFHNRKEKIPLRGI